MANGEMLKELDRLLTDGTVLNDSVVFRLILSVVRENYVLTKEVKVCVEEQGKRLDRIESDRKIDEVKEKDHLTWTALWDDYGKSVVQLILAVLAGLVLAKLGIVP